MLSNKRHVLYCIEPERFRLERVSPYFPFSDVVHDISGWVAGYRPRRAVPGSCRSRRNRRRNMNTRRTSSETSCANPLDPKMCVGSRHWYCLRHILSYVVPRNGMGGKGYIKIESSLDRACLSLRLERKKKKKRLSVARLQLTK